MSSPVIEIADTVVGERVVIGAGPPPDQRQTNFVRRDSGLEMPSSRSSSVRLRR
jgi:hypothetical protein